MEEPNNCVEVRRKHNPHPADVSRPFEDGNRCQVSAVAENVRISWNVAHPCNRAAQNRMSSFGSSKNSRASTLPGYRSHVPAQCSMEDLLSPGESFTSISATQSLGRNSSLPQPGSHSLRTKKAANSDRAAGFQQTKSSFLCHDCDPKLHKSSNRYSSVRKPANHEAKLLFAKKVSNFPVSDPVFLKNRMLKELTRTHKTSHVNEKPAVKNNESSNIESGAEKLPKKSSNPDNSSYSPKNKSPASAVYTNLSTHTEESCIPNHKFQELTHDVPSNALPSVVEDSNRILALQNHDRTNTNNKVTQKEDNGSVSVKSSFPLYDAQTRFRHSSFATTDEVPHLVEEKSISDEISDKTEEQETCQTSAMSNDTLPYSPIIVKDINQVNSQASVGIFEESNSLSTDSSVFHEAQPVKWEATSTDDGKIYFFNTESGDSNWELPEASARHPSLGGGSGNTSDAEETWPHSGPGTPTASPAGLRIVKQGMLMRTLYSREHKKVRKNWSSMCAMLVARPTDGPPSFGGPQLGSPSGPDASLRAPRYFFAFSKSAEDKKIRDEFELLEPVRMVVGAGKNKSSRSNILSLTNAAGTELLLRHDELSVIDEWHGVLQGLELKLVPPSPPASPKKQRNKSGDKDKGNLADAVPTSATGESLSTDQRTIRTKLLGFIKRRPTADALAKKGIIRDSVFGSTISELCMKEKTKSPLFVLRCINAIEKKESNLKADGLYRISGNAAMIQKIRYEVEKNNYEVLFEEKDVNNLTGALKLFFRELKEPLLPYNTYDRFIEWSQKTRRGGKHAEELYEIVKLLPKENFETLKVLLRHLRRVCDYGADNRMNFMNIAIVFGPCLIWPETTTGRDLMTEVMVHNIVVEGLLSHFE